MAADTVLAPQRIVVDDVWSVFDQRERCLREESRRPLDRRRRRALYIDGLVLAPVSLLCVLSDMPFIALAVSLSYFFVFEALTGQTIGKRRMGLRVVRLDGRPLGIASCAARNVMLPIDAIPGCYLVGFITMLVSRRRQRLGDLVAGTVVTWADQYPHIPADESARTPLLIGYPAAWLAGAALGLAILTGAGSGQRVYAAEVSQVCRTAIADEQSSRDLMGTFAGLEQSLAHVRPPAGMRAVHTRLLAAMERMRLDFAAVLASSTQAGHQLRLARARADEQAMRREFAGVGVDACL